MPGAGKSTIGIILAKNLGMGFIDTDVLIQINQQQRLQQIIDAAGHLHLRAIEANEVLKLNIENHVIATGGSVVYSTKAMHHLRAISTVVFLKVGFNELNRRIRNFETRGIAKANHQTFRDLFEERRILYNQFSDIIINGDDLDQEGLAEQIAKETSDY